MRAMQRVLSKKTGRSRASLSGQPLLRPSAHEPTASQKRNLSSASESSPPHDGHEVHFRETDFGYRSVPEDEKEHLVGRVFSSVASKYDVMNDLMSVGLHRLWKDRLVQRLRPFPEMQHVDVAGGTGDVALRILRAIRHAESLPWRQPLAARGSEGPFARVLVCDLSPEMLEAGQAKARAQGVVGDPALQWALGNAEDLRSVLPGDACVDSYSIAFGLRNVTRKDRALKEAHRVLKEGGQFVCLEFSHVSNPQLRQLYDLYSFACIPALGSMVAGDRDSYQYLVESIRRFPRQELLAEMMREAGFEKVTYENLTGGIVALHSGFKL